MLEHFFRRVADLSHGLTERPTASNVEVIDGDDIRWQGVNCRLVGYDAPETKNAKSPLERERGFKAAWRLGDLITNAKKLDIVPYHAGHDRWDRPLVRLLIDGVDVAKLACDEGWGRPYTKGRKPNWSDPNERFDI